MKIFISADIEGVAGFAIREEGHKGEEQYKLMAQRMTVEVAAACEAAHAAGADEIVVKDGHGDATNIDPLQLPDYVTLIRGKSGHPYNMMSGLDPSFDGVMYIGYHAPAGNPGFNVSHTSTGNTLYIKLNGRFMSEFMLNSFTAAENRVPVLFISGDETICTLARELVPAITTNVTKTGLGGSTYCVAPGKVLEGIKKGVQQALSDDLARCQVALPEEFIYEPVFKEWKKAYAMSFYPGMEQVGNFTLRLVTRKWLDVVTAHCFVVY